MTETSIADLFVAGVVPGIMIATVLALYSLWVNRHMPAQRLDLAEVRRALARGGWSAMLPVILLGGIYSGFFSATEAAAVALVYALFVEIVIHRELRLRDFYCTAVETAKLLGMLFPIVAVALSIKTILTIEEIPDALALWITEATSHPIMFLMAVNLLLLIVGCLFDIISAILILAPLLLAPALAYGIDPVHFGVIMVINLEIGFLTPPLGLNLIVAMTAFRESFLTICRSVLPFILLILMVLMIVTYVTGTALVFLR